MFEEAKRDWLDVFQNGSPMERIQQRLLLKATGSEFAVKRVYEPKRIGQTTAPATTAGLVILGAEPADESAGDKKLIVPKNSVAELVELNYYYREAAGGALTSNINASTLELVVGPEAQADFPKFQLQDFHRGQADNGLMFGALPLGIAVPPERPIALKLTGGGGSDSMDVRVSVVVRFEPLWLYKAAGLVRQRDR